MCSRRLNLPIIFPIAKAKLSNESADQLHVLAQMLAQIGTHAPLRIQSAERADPTKPSIIC
jgi:hypothetical protein